MGGLDYSSYEKYYDQIIYPVMLEYEEKNAGVILSPNAKEKIWDSYAEFNMHCKKHYMKDQEKLIDRHKLIACYMYAILQAEPIFCTISFQQGDNSALLLNERLSLCFGMTMLRALICEEITYLKANRDFKDKIRSIFEDDICFPKTNHGDYKHNLLVQLYHTRMEKNYNILSLAETLYLLECFNLAKNQIKEDVFKTE